MRRMLISMLCVISGAAAANAADWTCYLGPHRNNTSTDKNLSLWSGDNPKVLWKKNVGEGHSCMVVAGAHVYTQGNGAVWCLDAESGKTLWRWPKDSRGGETTATPAVAGGLVVALTPNHTVVALDGEKGRLRWSKKVDEFGVKQGGWALSGSPLILGNKVVMDLGVVFVLDKDTGELVWKAGSATAGYASAVVFSRGADKLVTSFNGSGLDVFNMSEGQPVAKYKWETAYGVNAATPIVSPQGIFISSGYGRGCSLLKLEGKRLAKAWENKEMNNHVQTCVLSHGYIYGVHGQQGNKGSLKCLDLATGKVQWDKKGLKVGGGLTLADGKLFVMLDGGTLLVAEASSKAYRELARAACSTASAGQCPWWPMDAFSAAIMPAIWCASICSERGIF